MAAEQSIRQLVPDDAVHLLKWLSDEQVLAFYEGRDRTHDAALVQEHFYSTDAENVTRCLVCHEAVPVGYLQFYPLDPATKEAYGYAKDTIVYGMDQFIGEPAYWNRGIGADLVQAVIRYVHQLGAAVVVMDPQEWNKRAIRCYEKCGFRQKKKLPRHEWHEGSLRDCLLMEWRPSPAEN
nr:GNAT family N-acetyltransferase [Brevibacillus sp. 1238]